MNGDRLADLVVGTPSGTPEGSRVAVLLGRTSPFPLEISPSEASAFGFVIDGSRSDGNFASAVAFPGDLDGDGHDDMALGSYVLFGREEWPSTLHLMEEVQMGSAVSLPSDTYEVRVAAPGSIEEGSSVMAVLESHECSGRVNLFLDGLGHGMGSAEPCVIITGDPDPVVLPGAPGGLGNSEKVRSGAIRGPSRVMAVAEWSGARFGASGGLVAGLAAGGTFRTSHHPPIVSAFNDAT